MNSRLLALSKMGVVSNYEEIKSKRVVIIGVGGIGSVAAEMLVRCGIGELVLFDYDKVEEANMNRMFYMPSQIGLSKVDAAKATLHAISPLTTINCHNGNICSTEWYEVLLNELSAETLLLCCVDNYAARLTINRACMQAGTVWMESGVSETAMSGHIQTMIPGKTACFECALPSIIAEGGDELQDIQREGVCTASLPTTMSIIAGLLVQNALKHLLGFGDVCDGCLGYEVLKDFFPLYPMKPSPQCPNEICRQKQKDSRVESPNVTPKGVRLGGIDTLESDDKDPQIPKSTSVSELMKRLDIAHKK
jgi:ubiquitin-like modifier-activating enzyme 5